MRRDPEDELFYAASVLWALIVFLLTIRIVWHFAAKGW